MPLPVRSTFVHVGCWVLASSTIYAVSAVRFRDSLDSLFGQPAFQALVASWQLHVGLSIAAYAALVFNVIALPSLLPPQWAPRSAFLLLALATSAIPVHLWRLHQGLLLAGVNADPRLAIRHQLIALLVLAFLWVLHFRLRSARAFAAHLGFAFLFTAYITSLAFP
jgi:hypothetical protein